MPYNKRKSWLPEEWTGPQVWSRALKMLARRNWGSEELSQKLQREYEVPQELAEAAVERLKELAIINDDEFAAQLVRMYKRRGYGPMRIRREMKRKFVAEERIDANVQPSPEEEQEQIVDVAQKKWGTIPTSLEMQKRKGRLYRFLIGRGFSSQAIASVLQSLR